MKFFKCVFFHNWGKWEYVEITKKTIVQSVEITVQVKECKDCGLKRMTRF
jgi:hypothetical protein